MHLTSRCRGITQHLGPSSDFIAGSTRTAVKSLSPRVNVNGGVPGWCRGESESETEEQTLPIPQHDTSPSTGHSILASAVDFLPFLATLVRTSWIEIYAFGRVLL